MKHYICNVYRRLQEVNLVVFNELADA